MMMIIKILDDYFITLEEIRDQYENDPNLRLLIQKGRNEMLTNGNFLRTFTIVVPPMRFLQNTLSHMKNFEQFDIVYSLKGKL